jgi:hypothetical protein
MLSFAFAISNLLGGLMGLLPDLLREIRESRGHARDMEHMRELAKVQAETAKATADSRLREAEVHATIAESKAQTTQLSAIIDAQAKPSGNRFVDAFNALLRPSCVTVIMALFTWTAVVFVGAMVSEMNAGRLAPSDFARMIEAGFVAEAFMCAFGFLFGARQTAKKA